MIDVRQTAAFRDWLDSLRDVRAQERINKRIVRLEGGLFGDVKYLGGIGELRIDYGPGYRLYFVRRENKVVILICGGDKSSQSHDIRRAIALSKEV